MLSAGWYDLRRLQSRAEAPCLTDLCLHGQLLCKWGLHTFIKDARYDLIRGISSEFCCSCYISPAKSEPIRWTLGVAPFSLGTSTLLCVQPLHPKLQA